MSITEKFEKHVENVSNELFKQEEEERRRIENQKKLEDESSYISEEKATAQSISLSFNLLDAPFLKDEEYSDMTVRDVLENRCKESSLGSAYNKYLVLIAEKYSEEYGIKASDIQEMKIAGDENRKIASKNNTISWVLSSLAGIMLAIPGFITIVRKTAKSSA